MQNYFIFWTPLLVMSAVLLYKRDNFDRKS